MKLCSTLMTVLALATAFPASACEYDDCHSSGAVSLPGGWDIRLPFLNGETVQILSGYGPTAGSSLHCRAQDSQCANDYYALDFVLPNHADSGRGQPVVAIASGTVLDAAWGSQGWTNYGQRIYIQHDYNADGHQYVSMYAHLESMSVSTGQHVSQGQQIGELGRSCDGSLECGSFSTPHVHFSIHRDSGFGGTGSGGSYGGRATIPEPLDGYSGIDQWDNLTSSNGAGGDDDDDATGDDDDSHPDDCLIVGETIIEEDGPCVSYSGNPDTFGEQDGHGNHAYYLEKDEPDPDYAQGINWLMEFPAAGEYELRVYVPTGLGNLTSDADYKVFYAGASEHVYVSQSASEGGWAFLGAFDFAAGGDQWVRLGDNYVGAADQGKNVFLDALKVTPVGGGDDDDDDTIPGDDDDATGPDDDDGQPGQDDDDHSWENGCGCTSTDPAIPPSPLLFITALIGLLRLRRP